MKNQPIKPMQPVKKVHLKLKSDPMKHANHVQLEVQHCIEEVLNVDVNMVGIGQIKMIKICLVLNHQVHPNI